MNKVLTLEIKSLIDSSATKSPPTHADETIEKTDSTLLQPIRKEAPLSLKLQLIYQDKEFRLLKNNKILALHDGDILHQEETTVLVNVNDFLLCEYPQNHEIIPWQNLLGSDTQILLAQLQLESNEISPENSAADPLAFLYSSQVSENLEPFKKLDLISTLPYPDSAFNDFIYK